MSKCGIFRYGYAMTASAMEPAPLSSIAGARIRGLRSELRLNQLELAQMVGLSRTGVSERESGVKPVNLDELPAFAAALGESIEYLIGLTDARNPRIRTAPGGGSMFVMPERAIGLRACRDSNPKPSDP